MILFILLAVITSWHNKFSELLSPMCFRFPVLYLPPALSRGNPQVLCVDKQDQPDVAAGPVEQIILELTVLTMALWQMHVGSGVQSRRTLSLTNVLKSWACKAVFCFLDSWAAGEKGLAVSPFTQVPSHIHAFITLANSMYNLEKCKQYICFQYYEPGKSHSDPLTISAQVVGNSRTSFMPLKITSYRCTSVNRHYGGIGHSSGKRSSDN